MLISTSVIVTHFSRREINSCLHSCSFPPRNTLKVLHFAGIKFRDFAIFSLNREIKYQGETFQVYNREIKYPRNLISGGSKTAFYHKKNLYFNYIIQLIYNNNIVVILLSFDVSLTCFSVLK